MTTFPNIRRDLLGIPHVEAREAAGLHFGQSTAHATDRGMPILHMRSLGRGRISKCFAASDASLRKDQSFRRVNWSAGTQLQVGELVEREAGLLQACRDGVNSVFSMRILWELGLPNLWLPRANQLFYVDQLPRLASGKMDLRKIRELAKEFSTTEETQPA